MKVGVILFLGVLLYYGGLALLIIQDWKIAAAVFLMSCGMNVEIRYLIRRGNDRD